MGQGFRFMNGIRTINVSLSPAQCLSDQLATDLSDIAGAHNVGLETFDFEVTESSIGDLASIGRQLAVLSDAGSTFALDDFGTGVSNLTRLMGLPINVVKLDVDVVQSYFLGKSTLLPDLVQMFRNAGMKTVLEGVETAEMMEGANLMGADYQQGYYFSRPLPPDQFVDYLKAQMSA
jgi:EAL domain-containing protein (putative c-di-GMP-specific phosphodiesterase class I)